MESHQRVRDVEVDCFGLRISDGLLELKGKKLLKRKTFRFASQDTPIPNEQRRALARSCLEKGKSGHGDVTRQELTALGQAKIAFVESILELCSFHRVKAFASIVDRDAERMQQNDFLRKDYSFLFERFFYYLEDKPGEPIGAIVFDELETNLCHTLLAQMEQYFLKTGKGRMRSSKIIPEPFFVHSELTSAIQLADIVAYIISWGVRVHNMEREARPELAEMAERVCQLRYRAVRDMLGKPDFVVWSFAVIDDLRPREDVEE